ncbi:hypothetical protein CA14_001659 [Aspergillus flavus]|uniref:Uncharacterized protein n=1 Tax=Aspergillus flavus TaxID=5059 RepID=A0AB74C2N6_ASPFL|nr:hypothetical protein CA14_001659 [Aspergillus flavus]
MPKRPRTRKFSQRQTSDDDAVSSREESANTRSSRVSANPSQSSEIEKALKELKKTIAGQRSAATFVAVVRSPSLGLAPVAAQEEMNAKKIVLPLNHASADSSPAALQQLASDCSPATFGRGSQDILDPSFRQAGKMEPANFATTFHPADLRIITLIERILLPSVINEPASSKVIPSSLVEPWTLTIYGQLDALLHNPQFLPNGGVLGIYYAHAYAHISKVANTNLPLTLKGSDLVLYSVLHALGATVSIQPVLEVDKGDYNWGHGLETEDGELVGEQLHPYHQSSSSTEYDPLDQIIRDEWPHSKMTGITWLTSQKHWEQALRYVAYGNESSVETSYSTAAIFATIPNWNKRSSSQ